MNDPERLLSTGPSSLERTLLESAMTPGPTNEQCDAVWRALEKRLGAGSPGGSGPATPASGGGVGATSALKSFAGWSTATAVVGAAAVAASLMWRAHASKPDRVPPAPQATEPLPQIVLAESAVVSAPPVATTAAAAAPVPRAVRRPTVLRPPSKGVEQPAPEPERDGSSLHEESLLLLRARRAWQSGDCEGALARLDEARARFPNGGLVQEREALSIEALACAGRAEEASTRAAAFLRDYPTSPHADGLRRYSR